LGSKYKKGIITTNICDERQNKGMNCRTVVIFVKAWSPDFVGIPACLYFVLGDKIWLQLSQLKHGCRIAMVAMVSYGF
jgi:hypothetical protein